jgi:hypothetical protein
MTEWTDQQRATVLAFLRRASGATGTLADEARSLVRWLDPPTRLPPADERDECRGGWIAAEDRYARRKALVAQLMKTPGHKLPASQISIPGITNRTSLHKWLTRQVKLGFLRKTVRKNREGGFLVGWYYLAEPAPK